MNQAEKIAGTYLRLNGFLLLPQFTIFDGRSHNHIDWVGLRAPNSVEMVDGDPFPTDDALFAAVAAGVASEPRRLPLGIAVEVKTNNDIDYPSEGHLDYVRRFLGGNWPIVPMSFSDRGDGPAWAGDHVAVGNAYALGWIFHRARWMDKRLSLTKSGSWTLSDDALSDLLTIGRYFGALLP